MSADIRFKLFWSEEDGEYVACSEKYPSLSVLDKDPVIALQMCRVLVREVERDE